MDYDTVRAWWAFMTSPKNCSRDISMLVRAKSAFKALEHGFSGNGLIYLYETNFSSNFPV